MFNIEAKCHTCQKKIHGNEEVYIKMKYPKIRGMTEIKAFIQNEGTIICQSCYEKR